MLYIWCTDRSNTLGYCNTAEKLPYSKLLYHSSCIYWQSIKPRLSWGQQCGSFIIIEIPEICFRVKHCLACIASFQSGVFSPQDNKRSKRLIHCGLSVNLFCLLVYLLCLWTSSKLSDPNFCSSLPYHLSDTDAFLQLFHIVLFSHIKDQ